ncbi:MAG TPA: CvpA family protein [Candidatus Saccharimonadales bacterium]|nr:CvpA family protein [Candidatus Saccharimonadales bacterium]
MDLEHLKFSWIDLITVGFIVVGLTRGRKRGMSEELLDMLKWLLVVVTGGYFYQPLGEMLSQATPLSTFFCYVAVYVAIILFFKVLFGWLKRRMGDKLVGSDVFGAGEYYLGMMGGIFRYLCILVVGLALLNARYYTPEELKASAVYQESNFGTAGLFPTLSSFQGEVFNESFTGTMARQYIGMLLIKPTHPDEKGMGANSIVRARERVVNEVVEKR